VEAADEYLAFVSHLGDSIEGLENDGTGALGRAEEANLGTENVIGRSSGPNLINFFI
jgi:hypothetical protein